MRPEELDDDRSFARRLGESHHGRRPDQGGADEKRRGHEEQGRGGPFRESRHGPTVAAAPVTGESRSGESGDLVV